MRSYLLIIFSTLMLTGCSLQKLTIRASGSLLEPAFRALMMEDDLPMARTAIESDLKLLDGLLLADPTNGTMLLLAAEGYTSYSLGFVEDEDRLRAIKLYRRAKDYANNWIEIESGISLAEIERLDEFNEAVSKLPAKAIPGVFWMANAWASSLLLSLDDVSSLSQLPKVETMMRFVLERDESFYHGGAHLFFTGYYGIRPKMLGGDPEKASSHIERHLELSGNMFMMGEYLKVKFVALPALNEELARSGLEKILAFDLDLAPEFRLPNRIAQEKAKHLLANLSDYL